MTQICKSGWRLAFVGVAALGAFTSAAQAQVLIGDFEGSDPGAWGYWNGGFQTPLGADPSLEFSAAYPTRGVTSVHVSNVGYDQNLAYQSDEAVRAVADDYTQILFDVTVPPLQGAEDDSGYWQVFELAVNSQNGGYSSVPVVNQDQPAWGNNIYWFDGAGASARTFTFAADYSAEVAEWAGAGPGGWLELIYSFNNDAATVPSHADAYIDNVRLAAVPEPASLGLALGAGLTLLRRRRA